MKIMCWNMGAAYGFRGEKHALAWEWLNQQDVDAALLQEVVPLESFVEPWGSVIFQKKYKNWGCAVLVRSAGYQQWVPGDGQPWTQRVGGAVAVARPVDGSGPWFGSVHSDAWSFEKTHKKYPRTYGDLPPRDGIARCNEKELWEIEVIAHELAPVLAPHPFVVGGDLNSSLLFDSRAGGENARLFQNLAALGFTDLRPRHSPDEVQTFFKNGTRPFQLDHVYADGATERSALSWSVLDEVASGLDLSDHAPILVETDERRLSPDSDQQDQSVS